ncbi:MAG TPA: DUF2961 domain-containing protein [Bryobacteraceae bacterium]|nr:DUF2961 domain-containing protein [Bryobacteraceae bacterium]
MKRHLAGILCGLLLSGMAAGAQENLSGGVPPLARLKDFTALRSSSNNADPNSNDDSKRPIPGETVILADLKGPGVVTHLWMTIASNEFAWPRLLRLRIYYDGSDTPSVDAPVGDFFAVGLGQERNVESLMVRDSSSGRARNCYWPMPFRKSARITVTNEGRRRTANLYYHVDWRKVKAIPPDAVYFHARYRQELPTQIGKPYEFLNVKGRGHYVGTVFSVVQNEPGWFGEGDEHFYVDGRARPDIEGTGTEDYFNDAWGLRESSGLYTGVSVADGTGLGSRMSAYRWHIADPVPFTKSLRFTIEHAGWTFREDGAVRSAFEERRDLFSSVAFWYQQGIAEGLEEPPYGAARLPHGNASQIEVERAIDRVKTENGKAEVQKEVFWSRDLLFFEAKGPGSRIDIPFDVAEDGNYELLAQLAHSPDYGIYTALLDGKPLESDVVLEHEPGANLGLSGGIDTYFLETYVAADHVLGWKKLRQGGHVLSFVCQGKNTQATGYNLGVDTLILSRLGRISPEGGERASAMRHSSDGPSLRSGLADPDAYVRAAAVWSVTQHPELAAPMKAELGRALSDGDEVVRGLAAVALTECRECARDALQQLIAALKDSDGDVRLKAADAIATLGKGATPAAGALTEAIAANWSDPQAERSIATALGAIGPAAAPAIPELKRLREVPRVQTQADAALQSIGAK